MAAARLLLAALALRLPARASAECECGLNVEPNVDYLGNDVKRTTVPTAEACCEFCRYQPGAVVWTYSTGTDFPQACWCKSAQGRNPACVGLACPRISGHFAKPCLPVGWFFVTALLFGTLLYLGIGYAYNSKVHGVEQWPHQAFWASVGGLGLDGVKFAAAGFGTGSGTGYKEVGGEGEKKRADETVEERTSRLHVAALAAALAAAQRPAKVGPRTKLHEAAMVGDAKAVAKALKALAKSKAADGGDTRGYTAFHHACAGGHVDCAKALLKAGCDAGRLTDGGQSGWALADRAGPAGQQVVLLLRKYGAKGHAVLGAEADWKAAAAAADEALLTF